MKGRLRAPNPVARIHPGKWRLLALGVLLLAPTLSRAAAFMPVVATPVAIDSTAAKSAVSMAPGTRLAAALELRSPDGKLGGLSSLIVDGDRLLSASDHGLLWQATIVRDGLGRIVDLRDWSSRRIPRPREMKRGRLLDVEGMTRDRDGHLVFSLERVQSLLVVDDKSWTPIAFLPLPPPLDAAPANEGPESVTTWPDGRLLVINEGQTTGANRFQAAIIGEGRAALLNYAGDAGFKPSDAQRLGQQLYVLSRRFSLIGGFAARVRQIDLSTVEGDELAGPQQIIIDGAPLAENYEGLSVTRSPTGGTFIYLIADDNFFPLQRTLLLQFEQSAP